MTKRKDFKYFMSLDYGIVTYKEKYGGKEYFVAEIPELKGCSAHGDTVEQANEELKKAKEAWIKSALADGDVIPLPEEYEEFSGKLILRINPRVHKNIVHVAKGEGLSLNAWLNKAIQDRLAAQKDSVEMKNCVESLKQEFINELKIQVGELRKVINVAIVERQDIPGVSLATGWRAHGIRVLGSGLSYTMVGSANVQSLGTPVGLGTAIGLGTGVDPEQMMGTFDIPLDTFIKPEGER